MKKALALIVHFLFSVVRSQRMQEPSELAVMQSCGCSRPIAILLMAPCCIEHTQKVHETPRCIGADAQKADVAEEH